MRCPHPLYAINWAASALALKRGALCLAPGAGGCSCDVNLAGCTFAVIVIGTVAGFAVHAGLLAGGSHGAFRAVRLPLLEALAAGLLTFSGFLAAHLDISLAAVHGVVVNTILYRTY